MIIKNAETYRTADCVHIFEYIHLNPAKDFVCSIFECSEETHWNLLFDLFRWISGLCREIVANSGTTLTSRFRLVSVVLWRSMEKLAILQNVRLFKVWNKVHTIEWNFSPIKTIKCREKFYYHLWMVRDY